MNKKTSKLSKNTQIKRKKQQNYTKNFEAILKFSNNVTEISRQLIAEIQIAEKKCQRNLWISLIEKKTPNGGIMSLDPSNTDKLASNQTANRVKFLSSQIFWRFTFIFVVTFNKHSSHGFSLIFSSSLPQSIGKKHHCD